MQPRGSSDGRTVVAVTKHLESSNVGTARLRQAEAIVESDPGVLGGEPCIRGTRIPVYLIAALAHKHGAEVVLNTYPALTAARIALAIVYAQGHPAEDRPKTALPTAKGPTSKHRVSKARHRAQRQA